MDWADKVDVLEYYPDVSVESASDVFPIPAVMRVAQYVYKNKPSMSISLSRANILLRDRHQCQYARTHTSASACLTRRDMITKHQLPLHLIRDLIVSPNYLPQSELPQETTTSRPGTNAAPDARTSASASWPLL